MSEANHSIDREDRAVLAALGVLEAADPERGLEDALPAGETAAAAETDRTLRRLYVETLGLLAWVGEAEAPAAGVKERVLGAIAGAAAPEAAPTVSRPAEADVVPFARGGEGGGDAAPPPRRRAWWTAVAAALVAGALGLAGWFYVQLDRAQDSLARLEAERARLAERIEDQEDLVRRTSGMGDVLSAVATAGVEVCPLRPVGDPALNPRAFAVLYMPPGSGEWYLLASNLEPGNGVYKVWLNTPDGAVPVGVLEISDGASALEFELPPDIDERHELMLSIVVTLEPTPDMPDMRGPMVLFGDEKLKVL